MRVLRFLMAAVLAAPPAIRAQSFAVDSTPCSARMDEPRSADRHPVVRTSADSTRAPASVVLFAAASAKAVTFNRQPEIWVRLCGGLDSVHVVERRNLPNPVVTGHTYRDVYVAVEIFGRLNADCITAALTGAQRDSTGQKNACASLEIGGARTRPPEP